MKRSVWRSMPRTTISGVGSVVKVYMPDIAP
jgi:hypothetical protein